MMMTAAYLHEPYGVQRKAVAGRWPTSMQAVEGCVSGPFGKAVCSEFLIHPKLELVGAPQSIQSVRII